MNITEFHNAAQIAFRGAWVKTAIELCTGDSATRYAVTVLPGATDDPAWAEATTPEQAIINVRDKLAKQREDKIEAAKKLLGQI